MQPQLEALVREFESASVRLGNLRRAVPPDTWNGRPAPDRWSPAECVAHLNLTSLAMLPLLRQGLENARRIGRPPGPRYRRDVLGWLIWRAASAPGRCKTKTTAPFVPAGVGPVDQVVAEFERLQAEQIAITREANGLPIDRVKMTSPFNVRLRYNVFSGLSILPRHQHRHLWQAEQAIR